MNKTGYASELYKSVYYNDSVTGYNESTLIQRRIANTGYYDLASVYPFSVDSLDLFAPPRDAITTTVITNPLGNNSTMIGEDYKLHAVAECNLFRMAILPENHRRNIKKCQVQALTLVSISPADNADDLINLYPNLIKRHNINGVTAYTPDQLRTLLKVPGAVLFKVRCVEYGIVNVSLFYIYKDDAYYHLSCQSDHGYKINSNFLMMYDAIRFFKSLGLNRVEIGSHPDGAINDGLARFKTGFSTCTLPNQIFKYIHKPDIYAKLCVDRDLNGYFPAYRQ